MIAQPEGSCDLENPRNWRTRTSAHVEMGGHHIQIDAAPEFRIQCIQNEITQIDTFILTHPHADHILGMDDLRRFCDLNGGVALPVFSSEDGIRRIREIFPYAIIDRPKVRGYPAFKLAELPNILQLPGGTVQSVFLPHGPMQVLGLVFTEAKTGKKLVYYTDCKKVPETARALAKDADVLVLDGLRPKVHPSHMTINEAVDASFAIQAKRSWLTHMTYSVDHDTIEAGLPRNIRLAYDGLTVSC